MNVRIERLRAAVAADRRAIAARIAELQTCDPTRLQKDAAMCALVAVDLHYLYGAVEAILERVARTIEGDLPEGRSWHRELLEEMGRPLEGVRPALLTAETVEGLRDLLGFRHFFRHAYAVALDPDKLRTLREQALRVREPLRADLDALDVWLQALVTARSE